MVKLDLSVDDWELFRYSRLVGTYNSSLESSTSAYHVIIPLVCFYDKTPHSSLSFLLIDHLQSPSSDELTKALLH